MPPTHVGAKARISDATAMITDDAITSGLRLPILSLSLPPTTLVMITNTA